MDNGWIKLHRKMLDNPVVMKDADHVAVWIYLLLTATHKERQTFFGGKKITLKPGQLITGRKKISEATGVQESKVKRIVKEFEHDHQIDQQTERYGSLISIVSWHEYQECDQQSDQQMTNKWTTSDQQVTTKQECKNERKKENNRRFTPPSVEEVRSYCQERNNKVNAEDFVDFYASKGWMVGKNKMKDWKACVRTWERNRKNTEPKSRSNVYVAEPPKYRQLTPDPEVDAVQMPDELRNKLRSMF